MLSLPTSQQTNESSQSERPPQFAERYIIKRIKEEDIEIDLDTRNRILTALANGVKYIQMGKYTMMVNAISGIDPKWGKDNIPPRPEEQYNTVYDEVKKVYVKSTNTNQEEIDLWDKTFGKNR